jgi:hypothetical protein
VGDSIANAVHGYFERDVLIKTHMNHEVSDWQGYRNGLLVACWDTIIYV